jgi:hypothetical protein
MNLTYESLVHLSILLLTRCYTELDRNYEHDSLLCSDQGGKVRSAFGPLFMSFDACIYLMHHKMWHDSCACNINS